MNTKIILIFSLMAATSITTYAAGSKPKSSTDAEANKIAKGAINGMVKDHQNKPLENAVIVITNTTARGPIKEIAPLTNAKGEFSLSGLPPGEYTLRANAPGFAPKDKKVKVEETKTSAVDFQMTK